MTADGKVVSPSEPSAVAFDAYGALTRVTDDRDLTCKAIEFLDSVTPGGSLLLWNDQPERTQAEVVALFNRAYARARKVEA